MYYNNARQNLTGLQLVLFGPSGHGKSTLGARFLHAVGGMTEREKTKLENEARDLGHPEHAWALYFDRRHGPVRSREAMHSIGASCFNLYLSSYLCTMHVAPGRLRNYARRIVAAYAMAELPVLVLSAHGTQFEESLEDLRQHILLMFTQNSNYYAGVNAETEKSKATSNNTNSSTSTTTAPTGPARGTLHTSSRLKKKPPLILVVTRLDPTHVRDTKARFEQIRAKVLQLAGPFFELVHAIPTFDALNIVSQDALFQGQAPMSFLDALSDEKWKGLIPATLQWTEQERKDRERQRLADHERREKQREIDANSKTRRPRQVVEIPEEDLCLSLIYDRFHIGGIGTVICGKQVQGEFEATRTDAPWHVYFCVRKPQEKVAKYPYHSQPQPAPAPTGYDAHQLRYKSLMSQDVTRHYEIRDAKVFTLERHHEQVTRTAGGALFGINIKPGLGRHDVAGIMRGSIVFSTPANCYAMAPRWLREKPYCVIATLVLPNLPGPEYLALNVRDRVESYRKGTGCRHTPSISKPVTLKSTSRAGKLQARREKRKKRKMGYQRPTEPYDEATCPYYVKPGLSKEQRRENAKLLHVGSTYLMVCHGAHTSVQVTSLRQVSNSKTRAYRVFLRPESFIQLSADPYFCKFALMDHNAVRGIGRVLGVFYEEALKVNLFLKCASIAESNLSVLNRDVISYIVQMFSLLFQ